MQCTNETEQEAERREKQNSLSGILKEDPREKNHFKFKTKNYYNKMDPYSNR